MDVHIADDYAILDGADYDFYFGWEETDDNDEWCFVAKQGVKEVCRIPQSELLSRLTVQERERKDNVRACLLLGIGWMLDNGLLTFAAQPEEDEDA